MQLFVSVLKFLRHRFVHTFTREQNERVNMAQNGEQRRRVEHNFKAQTELEIKPVEQVKNAVRSHSAPVDEVPVERLVAREKPAYLAVGGPQAQVARIQQDRGGKNNEIVQSFWQAEQNVSGRDGRQCGGAGEPQALRVYQEPEQRASQGAGGGGDGADQVQPLDLERGVSSVIKKSFLDEHVLHVAQPVAGSADQYRFDGSENERQKSMCLHDFDCVFWKKFISVWST